MRVIGTPTATDRAASWRGGGSLKTRMALAVALLIGLSLALAAWFYARHFSHGFRASVTAQQSAIAERLAAEIGSKVEAQRHQLERFAASLGGMSLDDEAGLRARLKAFGEFHAYIDDFWIVRSDGRITADFPMIAGRVGLEVADREYFKRLRESGGAVLSNPFVSRFGSQPLVLLLVPLRGPSGETAGAVAGVIRLLSPRFLGDIKQQKIGATGYVGVLTRGGTIVAHPDPSRIMEQLPAGRNAVIERTQVGLDGSGVALSASGVVTVYTTRQVPGTDWIAYTAYPSAEAYGNLRQDLQSIAAMAGLVALCGGLLAWFWMARLLAPLSLLERELRRVAADTDISARVNLKCGGEIEGLSNSFNQLLAAREDAQNEREIAFVQIRRTGGLFDGLFKQAPIGLALLRDDGGFIRANPAYASITGYSDEALATMSEQQLSAPEGAAADALAARALATAGVAAPYDKEYVACDGRRVAVRVSSVMVGDDGVDPVVWRIVEDIGARRQALDSLRQTQERLQRAIDGSNDVIWEKRFADDAFFASDRLNTLLGHPSGKTTYTRSEWEGLIHPDDLARHRSMATSMHASNVSTVWDTRMRSADGGYRWLRRRGRVVLNAAGGKEMTAGTMSDVHEARLVQEELALHRDHLAQMVADRTAGLEQARAAAERANLSKTEFLANMSHELRTPMHAILSFANFGVDKHRHAERDKLLHYFSNIQKSGTRLLRLLNDLLDLSKLEAGKMSINPAPLNVADLLADALAEAEALAQTRQVAIEVDAAAATLRANWDAARMLQVLRNLISNALKFSLAGGRVRISALAIEMPAGRRAGDPRSAGIEIRVCDAGIGIPQDELEAVFDKFVQSSKTKTGAGGTGLGLAICREIVLAHGGRIHAENNPAAEGGATFVVHLPVSPATAARALEDGQLATIDAAEPEEAIE